MSLIRCTKYNFSLCLLFYPPILLYASFVRIKRCTCCKFYVKNARQEASNTNKVFDIWQDRRGILKSNRVKLRFRNLLGIKVWKIFQSPESAISERLLIWAVDVPRETFLTQINLHFISCFIGINWEETTRWHLGTCHRKLLKMYIKPTETGRSCNDRFIFLRIVRTDYPRARFRLHLLLILIHHLYSRQISVTHYTMLNVFIC